MVRATKKTTESSAHGGGGKPWVEQDLLGKMCSREEARSQVRSLQA